MDLSYVPLALVFGIGVALFWSWLNERPIWPIRVDRAWLRSLLVGLAMYALFRFFGVAFELQVLVLIAVGVASWIWNRGERNPPDARGVAYRRR